MSTLERAISIAKKAHKGQTDKYGAPYILHPLRVMHLGRTEEERIVGVLHDVVEDCPEWPLERLKQEGFTKRVIDAIGCLTKESDNADYNLYLEGIRKNALAIRVKLNDLTDNMDVRRMDEFREKDVKRFNKYLHAYKLLQKDMEKLEI